MTEKDYFNSRAIGSSLLAAVIARDNPLQLCFDRATLPIKPTGAMEVGKMFEDMVEEEFSGEPVFSDKYFHSSIQSIPTTSKKGLKDILAMLDGDNLKEDVENGYVLKADETWNSTYANRNQCLKEIQAHDYRRPIPDPTWEKLQIMFERFKAYPFEIEVQCKSLGQWMTQGNIKVDFQVEHFWKHASGAECREKLDMIWSWQSGGDTYAMPFDLKVTGNWQKFEQNWKYKYIWQSKHYLEGFFDYCAKNGLIPDQQIYYLIQESSDPQIASARALSVQGLASLTKSYDETIARTWQWIEAGKPIKGYVEQQIVDRWGNPNV